MRKQTIYKFFFCLLMMMIVAPSLTYCKGEEVEQSVENTFEKAMQPILSEYMKIQEALASDSTDGVVKAAKEISDLSLKLDEIKVIQGEHAKHYEGLAKKIGAHAQDLTKANNIEQMREKFKELSKPMALWGSAAQPKDVIVVYCSMAPGSWLQKKGDIRNPYYGASMLSCGDIVSPKK